MWESESIDHEKLLDVLGSSHEKGVSLFALSRKTRTPLHRLHKYFRSHRYAFQAASIDRNYRLNQKAPYYGDVEKIRRDLLQKIARERSKEYLAYGVIGFGCLYSVLLPLFLIL